MLYRCHLDNVIEVILSRAARRPSGKAATQLFSDKDLDYYLLIKKVCMFLPMLNSSRLTQFDNDLGMFPVCSWLYLSPSLER